jgi:hypothetical protein
MTRWFVVRDRRDNHLLNPNATMLWTVWYWDGEGHYKYVYPTGQTFRGGGASVFVPDSLARNSDFMEIFLDPQEVGWELALAGDDIRVAEGL